MSVGLVLTKTLFMNMFLQFIFCGVSVDMLNFSLDLQEKAENSSISVQNIMGHKNVCALEFACILGLNIKSSVIIIIIIIILYVPYSFNPISPFLEMNT